MSETLELVVARINQCLKVSRQMCPAPLQGVVLEVHLRPVAVDAARKVGSDGLGEYNRFASRTQHKHRKTRGHERPEPRLETAAFERRFIDRQVRLIGQDSGEFVIEMIVDKS